VSVADIAVGLPAGFDLSGKKSLGLRVVHTEGGRFALEFDASAT
jgi:hypothetical protein